MRLATLLMFLLTLSGAMAPSGASSASGIESSQEPVADLIADLCSEDWQRVERAKLRLESTQAAALSALVALLDRDDVVALRNTADLIYPGAKQFYGHGFIVDYDLDRISVRAGWVLEESTFENFGFSEGTIREADLLEATVNGKTDVSLRDVVPPGEDSVTRERRLSEARNRAREWWKSTGSRWTRFGALKDALDSGDAKRQVRALSWLRYGKTRCDGLNQESYARDLLPAVRKLTSSSDDAVREQARLLVGDREGWWWKSKSGSLTR